MDPHERTSRFPYIEYIAFSKPRGRATVMGLASNIVVYPWIRGRQPTANVLLQLVTYKVVSVYTQEHEEVTNVRTC